MLTIQAKPLTAEAFAPYGEVLTVPAAPGRDYFDRALSNGRPDAWPSLSIARVKPLPVGPIQGQLWERHRQSSQCFVPIGPARWLVVVAPKGPDGGPDQAKALAFAPAPGQGINYAADVWHHPMVAIGGEASFLVFMWRDGTSGDTDLQDLTQPFEVTGA